MPSAPSQSRISRSEYIKYVIEIVILRSRQLQAHEQLSARLARRTELLGPKHSRDPRLGTRLKEFDQETKQAEDAVSQTNRLISSRLDYLVGARDVPPPHDVLYPHSHSSLLNDPDELVSWAETKARTVRDIVNKLKDNLLLDYSAPSPSYEASDDGGPLKKRRLGTGRLPDGTFASSSSTTATPAPAPVPAPNTPTSTGKLPIEDLFTRAAALGIELDVDAKKRLDEQQKVIVASMLEKLGLFQRLAVDLESTRTPILQARFEQLEKDWKVQHAQDVAALDEIIGQKRERNEKLQAAIDQAKARLAKLEGQQQEIDSLLAQLTIAPPPAPTIPPPTVESLYENPEFLAMVEPIEWEIRSLAIETLRDVYLTAWKDLETKTLDLRDEMVKTLWDELGKATAISNKLLDVVYANEQRGSQGGGSGTVRNA